MLPHLQAVGARPPDQDDPDHHDGGDDAEPIEDEVASENGSQSGSGSSDDEDEDEEARLAREAWAVVLEDGPAEPDDDCPVLEEAAPDPQGEGEAVGPAEPAHNLADGDALAEPAHDLADGVAPVDAAHDQPGDVPGFPPVPGVARTRGTFASQMTVNGGVIAFYDSNQVFQATCTNPFHGACVLTRKNTRRSHMKGRPVGFLVAWLAQGPFEETKDGHWKSIPHIAADVQARADARGIVEGEGSAASIALLSHERQLDAGEPHEPV